MTMTDSYTALDKDACLHAAQSAFERKWDTELLFLRLWIGCNQLLQAPVFARTKTITSPLQS